MINNAAGVTW